MHSVAPALAPVEQHCWSVDVTVPPCAWQHVPLSQWPKQQSLSLVQPLVPSSIQAAQRPLAQRSVPQHLWLASQAAPTGPQQVPFSHVFCDEQPLGPHTSTVQQP